MNLYLLEQDDNTGYDTFDSCVVVANDETEARQIHPGIWERQGEKDALALSEKRWHDENYDWAKSPESVTATNLGKCLDTYNKPQIICSSFNAG